jgi:branched-chain amino acid transport system permease protein
MLIFAIFALSLNLLLGYAGQISVGHAGLGAAGGYAVGYLAVKHGTPYIEASIAGVAAATILGTAVSFPALKLAQVFVILLTLAFSTVFLTLLVGLPYFGGSYGLVGVTGVSLFGIDLIQPSDWVKLLLPVFAVVFISCWRIGESPFGRVLKGIRDDEIATRSLGKDVFLYKSGIFSITSAMAGLGGVSLVYYNQLASPSQFTFSAVTTIVAMVIIGGMGNLVGTLVGVFLVVVSGPFLEKQVHASADHASLIRLVIYGAALVVVMRLRPEGILPEGTSLKGAAMGVRRLLRKAPAPEAVSSTVAPVLRTVRAPSIQTLEGVAELPAAVEVTGLIKHFGGIHAVDGLDFRLPVGKITGLVGPNGAGKTTVFNLITGAIRPDAGVVLLNGTDITNLAPHRVARKGMVRSFQDVRLLPRLSVLDNVSLAVPDQPGERLGPLFLRPMFTARAERRVKEKAREALRFVGMEDRADYPAGALGYGEQKLVALARMLATEASVLLLDEPASGIDQSWLEPILEVVLEARDMGKTICLVEHNLHIVERLADWVYFMEAGAVTAQGSMQDLVKQPRLAEVYFGNA